MTKQKEQPDDNNSNNQPSEKRIPTNQQLPQIQEQEKQQSPPIQVGLAKFKQRFSLKKKKQLIDKRKKDIFQADNWFIGTSYYRQQWKQLFQSIQSATCSSIVVQFDYCQNILLDFSRPRFICLKQLVLVVNGITNIEALNFLNADLLQNINLQGNSISTCSTLNKLKYSMLHHLDLSKNVIAQMKLTHFKSHSPHFALDYLIHQNDRQMPTMSFYAKMQKKEPSQSLRSTLNSFSGVKYSYSITQKNACKAIKRKFMEWQN